MTFVETEDLNLKGIPVIDSPTFTGEMAILSTCGDTKLRWDKHNADEVDVARKAFDSLKKKGYTAFCVDKKGDKEGVMREFDPDAESVIMSPRVVGG